MVAPRPSAIVAVVLLAAGGSAAPCEGAGGKAPRKPDPDAPVRVIPVEPIVTRVQLAFAPDGKLLAATTAYDRIAFHDLVAGRPAGELRLPDNGVLRFAFAPDGKTLATGGIIEAPAVRTWDVRTRKLVRILGRHEGGVSFVAYTPDGRCLVSGNGGQIVVQEVATGGERLRLRARAAVDSVAVSPDGKLLAAGVGDGTGVVWNLATAKVRHVLPARPTALTGAQTVAFAPDSGALLTGGADGRLRVWDMAEGKELRNFGSANGGAVLWVAWSPDDRAVASARSGGVAVWGAADGKKLAQWTNGAFAVAFAPDSARLAYAGDGGVYLVPVPARAAPRK